MINPQLLEYVRAQRAAGLSKDAITQALAQGGWSSQDANEAFMAIEGVKTPPMAPAAPGPVAPRVITQTAVPGTAVNPAAPASQQPMGGQMSAMTPPVAVTPRPMMAASELKTAPVAVRHTGRWILIIVIILLLLGIGGVAAWIYMNPSVISSYLPGSGDATPTYVPSESPTLNQPESNTGTTTTTTATSTATTTSGTTSSTTVSVTATTTVH